MLNLKKTLSCFFVAACSQGLYALETKPWLGDVYAFELQSAFTYYRFHDVEGASKQLSSPENVRVFSLDLGWTPFPTVDVQLEGEFAKINQINWGLRSTAIQTRYQLLDDISGDPVSLTFGLNLRYAPHHFLKDVSTPYASEFNMEVTGSIGKEWAEGPDWRMRIYGLVALGMANRGYPWTRELFVWQYNLENTHRFTLFAQGDFGFGKRQHVNVKHFDGWAKFQHQSLDLGLSYGYKISVYGVLSASYMRRIFAHNFPENVNFFTLSYCLPFSLF